MHKDFEGSKKSVHYLMYLFINLSKAATERCPFKQKIPNFLKIE